ncbi:MAG: porin family protein [bacterium]
MKNVFFCFFIIIIITINTKLCFGSNKHFPVIKMGINFNKFYSPKGDANIKIDKYPKFDYPLGYMAGLSWEKRLTKNLSFMPEMFYEKDILEVTIYTGEEGILDQKIINHYIRIPCLLKYQMDWLFDIYVLGGIDLGFLLKSKYKYSDFIYRIKGEHNITNEMNRIDASLDCGLGMPLEIRDISFLVEVRYLIGLMEDTNDYPLFEKWKTHSVQIIIGMKLN